MNDQAQTDTQNAEQAPRKIRLFHLWAAAAWLDKTPDEIILLIDSGEISYAFDISCSRKTRREIRVLAPCLQACLSGEGSSDPGWPAVANYILHQDKPNVSVVQLAASWSCGTEHIYSLVKNGDLAVSKSGTPRRGPNGSALLHRPQVLDWLLARRII